MKMSFAIAVFVIAVPSLVRADCAWVLWEHKTGKPLVALGRDDEWTISTAVPTFDECKAEVKKAVELVLTVTQGEPKPAKLLTERAVVIYGDSGELMLAYICLPGTLDPRPR